MPVGIIQAVDRLCFQSWTRVARGALHPCHRTSVQTGGGHRWINAPGPAREYHLATLKPIAKNLEPARWPQERR